MRAIAITAIIAFVGVAVGWRVIDMFKGLVPMLMTTFWRGDA